MKEGAPLTQEQGPVMRDRPEALQWVREKIEHILDPEVISESVKMNPQVAANGELHDVDLKKHHEFKPIVGFQHVISALEGLLEQAKESRTMPHEERLLTLIINRFKGNEQSAKVDADIIGLEERFPGSTEIVSIVEDASSSIMQFGAEGKDNPFSQKKVA